MVQTIVCKNIKCPWNQGIFCKKEFIVINGFAQCGVIYADGGNPRAKIDDIPAASVKNSKSKPEGA